MSGILRTPADDAISKACRAGRNYICQRCFTQHLPNSRGLHCSHHHSRGNWSIRLNPLNLEVLCYGCHQLVGGTEERRQEVLTEAEQEELWTLKRDTNLGKAIKRTKGKGKIAKHYRDELKRIQSKRNEGYMGYLEVKNWMEG